MSNALHDYERLESRLLAGGGEAFTKPGVRAYPDLHPGVALLAGADLGAEHLVDATGSAGAVGLTASPQAGRVTVLEASRAALRCARRALEGSTIMLAAGAPWDAPPGGADAVCLFPATDRGTARVEAELQGAYRALNEGGAVYLVMHKDQGAKRYEKTAAGLFGELTTLAKSGGWRLSRALKRRAGTLEVAPQRFEAAGLDLSAEPGVYAAGKLDPGSAFLLETFELESLAGKRVLDLGCGYGLLALKAALAGAEVSALDDDLSAVRSTYRNAKTYGLDLRCLHSDVVSELHPDMSFDAVVTNPPFHVGKAVQLAVPHAFIAGAARHLSPGGELVLVANRALAYEERLEPFAYWETLGENKTFKVLRAIK